MILKCPHCDHTEQFRVKVTLFPAKYLTSGKTAIEAQPEILDQADFERRFAEHYDAAGHKPYYEEMFA
jgi:hypothetical protein